MEPAAVLEARRAAAQQRTELRAALRARTPVVHVTHIVVTLNVAIFLLMVATSGSFMIFPLAHLVAWGANHGPRTTGGEWWRLLSAAFVHVGFPHLLVNVAGLVIIAPLAERLAGARGFAVLYLAWGLASSALSVWSHPHLVSVGASGALLGCYGFLIGAMFERRSNRLPTFAGEPHEVPRRLLRAELVPAVAFVTATLGSGLVLPNIDNAGHAGGLAAGALSGWLLGGTLQPRPTGITRALPIAAGAVVCCAIAIAATNPVVDVPALMLRVFENDSRIHRLHAAALTAKAPPKAQILMIETQVLPILEEDDRALASAGWVPARQQRTLRDLRTYVALREQAWRARAQWLDRPALDGEQRVAAFEERADIVMRRMLRRGPG